MTNIPTPATPTSPDDLFLKYWNKVGFCVCTQGQASIMMDGKNYQLQPNQLYMITPLIQIQSFSPSADYECILLMEDVKVFFPTFHTVVSSGLPLFIKEHPCWKITEEEMNFLQKQYTRIEQKKKLLPSLTLSHEISIIEHLVQLITKETFIEIVFNYVHLHSFSSQPVSKQSLLIYHFIIALHQHYKKERSVNFYAEKAQLSPGHFTHIVKSNTGKTPSEWIILFTITYTKYLLEKSDLRIKEIAEELHFPEQFTFRKYFKRYTGMSPKEFRTRNK